MKFYVLDKEESSQKIYLDFTAETREGLARSLGNEFFSVNNELYTVWEVFAEKEGGNTGTGTFLGGIVGLIAGPAGMIIGGLAGAALGNIQDQTEEQKIDHFNNS